MSFFEFTSSDRKFKCLIFKKKLRQMSPKKKARVPDENLHIWTTDDNQSRPVLSGYVLSCHMIQERLHSDK